MRVPATLLSKLQNQFTLLRNGSLQGLSLQRRLKSYYITTPIFYVNSVPHIGHLYTVTLADAACRWQALKHGDKESAKLVSGTDEHGSKVMQAAHANKLDTKQYCDKVSLRFRNMYDSFGINYYDFIQTTEERHEKAVQQFWKSIYDNGYIYKGTYEGWYSTADETFVNADEVHKAFNPDTGEHYHMYAESGHKVEWTKESNYKFKLSELVGHVHDWIIKNPKAVYPEKAKNCVLAMLDQPILDLSISRERSRVPWGIQVPDDPTQTVYVWMDALVNYLTVTGYPNTTSEIFKEMWPADCHVVGIDIVKFHAIYWPAFLIAAGLELPKQVVVHSHWTVDHLKMSKSKGNVVDPFEIAKKVTTSGFRYFLLKQGVLEHNCNYSHDLVYRTLNADLANELGNCLFRAVAKHLNPSQTYPRFHRNIFPLKKVDKQFTASSEDYEFIQLVRNLPEAANKHAEYFHFHNTIGEIAHVVRESNVVIQRHTLWNLDKFNPEQLRFLETLLHCTYEGLRVSAILLQPIIPELADQILTKLGVPQSKRTWLDAERSFLEFDGETETQVGMSLGKEKAVLFKRLKTESKESSVNPTKGKSKHSS